MLLVVYSIICMGAISASFLAFYDQELISDPSRLKFSRIATMVLFALCWYEPLLVSTGYIENRTGIPWALMFVLPLGLLGPYFYNTYFVFTDPMMATGPGLFYGLISAKGRFHVPERRRRLI
jgi:hypothetical protein